MALKSYRPVTASRRHYTTLDFNNLTKTRPHKALSVSLNKTGGRNCYGRITTRHHGGGSKRKYRIIDFKRNKDGIPAKVATIEYDPNRSCNIALLHYSDGEKRYIVAPLDLKVGDQVVSGDTAEIMPGNTLSLAKIPTGSLIHNIELKIGKGGQIARSAGGYAQLLAHDNQYAHVRLPSGEVRLIHAMCRATIGQVGNIEHENITIGKAGRTRWLGRRPHVRGVAMNPVDHPLGGGEGKTSGGRHPVSPWGIPAKGYKTRRNRQSDKFIIKRRKK